MKNVPFLTNVESLGKVVKKKVAELEWSGLQKEDFFFLFSNE